MQVVAKACPLFVPLAEEGFLTHPATRLIAQEYLNEFQLPTIDTLILGCTHYPLLREVIQKTVGQEITLIDSAFPTAQELKNILEAKQLQNHEKHPEYRFYVTDAPQRVSQTAQLFFDNRFPGKLEKTEL
jgi:glutamate racemase